MKEVKVTEIHLQSYSGHVYDLSVADDESFVAGGIAVSNCRCNWAAISVRKAASKGVKEAQEWWDRAVAMAAQEGGTPYQYIESTKPMAPAWVQHPPFNVPEAFRRP